jgi:hypothetical protein
MPGKALLLLPQWLTAMQELCRHDCDCIAVQAWCFACWTYTTSSCRQCAGRAATVPNSLRHSTAMQQNIMQLRLTQWPHVLCPRSYCC